MAWIESHQTLAGHPKTRKLAHILGVSKPAAIGHLHCLWWWAMDYAENGSLYPHDALDIAIGAEWEGDPDAFVDAMVSVGFLDQDDDGLLKIHDWDDYAGKLIERRHANAERMRKARAERESGTDNERAEHVQRTQRARVERPNPTVPNQPNQTKPTVPTQPDSDADAPPVVQDQPFWLLESLCETLGQNVTVLSPKEKSKQLAVAQRLVAAGITAGDVATMTRWLTGQSWMTGGIDLFSLERNLAKWQLAGKPANVTRIGGSANGRASPVIDAAEASRIAWRKKHGLIPDDDPEDVIDARGRVAQ